MSAFTANPEPRAATQRLWEDCFGEPSVLHCIHQFELFSPLFRDVEFEIGEHEVFDAVARRDGPAGCAITLTTGSEEFLLPIFEQALGLLARQNTRPWRLLGWPRNHFVSNADAARRLAAISLDFICLHEFAHIILGHVDYVGCRTGSSQLVETGWSMKESADGAECENPALPGLDRRALEVGADSAAAFFIHFLRKEIVLTSPRYASLSDVGFLRVFAFVSQVVFAEFARLDVKFSRYRDQAADRSHPHPSIRAILQSSRFERDLPSGLWQRWRANRAQRSAETVVSYLLSQGAPYAAAYEPWIRDNSGLLEETNVLIDRLQTLAQIVQRGSCWEALNQKADAQGAIR